MNDIAVPLLVLFVGFVLGAIFGVNSAAQSYEKECRLTQYIRFNDTVYACSPKP